jgi:hypothetical protein
MSEATDIIAVSRDALSRGMDDRFYYNCNSCNANVPVYLHQDGAFWRHPCQCRVEAPRTRDKGAPGQSYEVDLCTRCIAHAVFGGGPGGKLTAPMLRDVLANLFTLEQISAAFAALSTRHQPKKET